MVKSYLRYVPSSALGVVVSANSNILCVLGPSSAKQTSRAQPTLAIAPALESIKIWNVKTSVLLASLHDAPSTAEVTALVQNPVRKNLIAAGYEDGSIRVWAMNDAWTGGELAVTFNGHKSAITTLCFDTEGNRLASGSRDTDVVLWDIVSEEGIARLRSHQDQITGLSFLTPPTEDEGEEVGHFLLSAGKDGLIKIWDLGTNFCVETHLAHRGEIWAAAVSPAQNTIVTAGPDGELKFWSLKMLSPAGDDGETPKLLSQKGAISRTNRDKPLSLKFHPSSGLLAVHASNRNIEVFRIRSEEEIKKSLSRKRKRKAKKEAPTEETDESSELEVANQVIAYTTIRATAKVRSIDWDTIAMPTAVQVVPSSQRSNSSCLYLSTPTPLSSITFRSLPPKRNQLSNQKQQSSPLSSSPATALKSELFPSPRITKCSFQQAQALPKSGTSEPEMLSEVGIADTFFAAHFSLVIRLLFLDRRRENWSYMICRVLV